MIRLPLPVWAAAETVAGGGGNDTLQGGAATQAGGAAGDTLQGGAGADTLKGGDGKTSMQRGGEGVVDPVAPADFPADWRERMAVGADGKPDPKRVEQLKRYANPAAAGAALFEAQGKIRSPSADVPMPDPAKDAEGAKKWREERGIPEDATGYKLPDTVTKALTDADKPVLADFTTFAHKKGASPAAVAVAAEWYTDFNARQMQQQSQADKESSSACDDVLREEYGTDFKPMMNVAGRYAQELFGAEGADLLTMARFPTTPDIPEALRGRRLGDIPQMMKGFVGAALDKYGDVSFVGGQETKKTEDRMAEIKRVMDTDFAKYDGDPAMKREYRELLQKAEKRQAAKAG